MQNHFFLNIGFLVDKIYILSYWVVRIQSLDSSGKAKHLLISQKSLASVLLNRHPYEGGSTAGCSSV